jgi:NADPH:quinone reductase
MRAMMVTEIGGPEVLALRELPIPKPAQGQVLIRVAYIGVNFADLMARKGQYYGSDVPFVPGVEASGYIEDLGEGVENLSIGQAVCAFTGRGAYAEYVLAQAIMTFPLTALGPEPNLLQAAAFPTVVPTSYDLLVSVARFHPGETLLVHAASGAVGLVALQLARHLQAGKVFGTVSTEEKAAYARSIGYDEVFLLKNFVEETLQANGGQGVDIILDSRGEPVRSQSLTLLAPFGRLIIFGGVEHEEPISPTRLWRENKGVLGYSMSNLSRNAPKRLAASAQEALKLVAASIITLDITKIIPFEQAAEAHRLIENRQHVGKLLLQV